MLSAEVLYAPDVYKEPWKKKPFANFTDNHMHIDPLNGEGIEAVKKFENSGGKFLFLVSKTTKDWNLKGDKEGFSKLFDFTIDLSKKINEKTRVKSFPVIGVHPAEFAHMCGEHSIKASLEVAKKAIDLAGKKILDGQAVAIGEVGRPHYKVSDEILNACNKLLVYAFETAAEVDCTVQLHTESITKENFEEFRKLAASAGLNPSRVIKHYSPPLIKAAEVAGVFPSLIASEENVENAIKEGNRFLMESDYIDDLKRPGAVVGPTSVPKVSARLLKKGILSEEDLWKIHKDNVEKAYNLSLDV